MSQPLINPLTKLGRVCSVITGRRIVRRKHFDFGRIDTPADLETLTSLFGFDFCLTVWKNCYLHLLAFTLSTIDDRLRGGIFVVFVLLNYRLTFQIGGGKPL